MQRPWLIGFIALLVAWGGMGESAFAGVLINEIMFQRAGIPENTAAEFIELYNPEAGQVDVGGWQFTAGVSFTIPNGTFIPAGGYLVVAANVTAFQAAYPGVTNVIGGWTGTLSNSAEDIELTDAAGALQDRVEYADEGDWATRVREGTFGGWEWQTLAAGGGRSLELRNAALDNNSGQNWGASTANGGTPGAVNSIASTNIAPIIRKVRHTPAVPTSTQPVTISCQLSDESVLASLSATLFWREVTSATPPGFQSKPMASDGAGGFSAMLDPLQDKRIVEFYVQATDGTLTRTWPAATSEGQNANCQYQVDNEAVVPGQSYYRLTLTAAENSAFVATPTDSNRQFNQTLIVVRGTEADIRYRSSMRIRGNSSRQYQFKPLRISIPSDDPLDGITAFNLAPRSSYLQFLGMRLFQAAGLRCYDAVPVELRRNGVESSSSTGSTPDYGKWTRLEEINGDAVSNHWPTTGGGNIYKKGRPDQYWRATQPAPTNPDSLIDGWSKQNNGAANDWSDLLGFFQTWQTASAPHFPGAPANNVANAGGQSTTGNGLWNGTAFSDTEVESLNPVADLDQWARWFAVMTILQDNETNVSNGQDDDYTCYFRPGPGGERRMELIPHDMDTIFGLGETQSQLAFNARGLYDMTDNGSVFRPLLPLFGTNTTAGNAAFRTKYFTALRELYGTVFDANTTGNPNPAFYQFVDSHLTGWVPAGTISTIKTFATQRQTYLLGLIGSGPITPPAATSTASITSAHGSLMISEVLADNVAAVNVGGLYPDVIELHNAGTGPADLSGMTLTDDPAVPDKFTFAAGTSIASGGYLLLYADSSTAAGHLPFSIGNGGERLELRASAANGGTLIDAITFGLQISDFSIGRTGANLDVWTLCIPTLGAANQSVTSFAAPGGLRINEWLGNIDYQLQDDFVELYNPAAQPVALGGMSLTDDFINFPSRPLPQLSFMAATSFRSFDAKGGSALPGNAAELPFKFSSTSGWIALLGQNGSIVDRVDIVSQSPDVSQGRSPDGGATIANFGLPVSVPTPGASNAIPPAGILALYNGLRITEVLYKPNNLEFIELQNVGTTALDLGGVRLMNAVDYTFAPGTTLAPGSFIVVCKDRTAFTTRFGAAVPLAPGVFAGSLDNSGETIMLRPPVPWEANILSFFYDPAWYAETNNDYSLTAADPYVTPARDWDEKSTWVPSTATGGTPGLGNPPIITSAATATGVIGDAFSYQIRATSGPTSYGATGLPSGLTVNTSNGLITGTPTAAGVFNCQMSATNATGTNTGPLTITIATSGPLASFVWESISSPQQAGVPFPATLRAVDAQGRTVVTFTGPVTLSGGAGRPPVTVGTGTSSWEYPLGTFYHDARTQSIYLASEIGSAGTLRSIALDVTTTPGQTMTNWTIRVKHTSLSSYTTSGWESTGWTTAYRTNQTIGTTGLTTFVFTTPFAYNGTSNLMVDFSFNNNSYTTDGQSRFTQTATNRSLVYQTDSGFGDPITWNGTTPTPEVAARIPNLQLVFNQTITAISPTSAANFVNGVWTGNILVNQTVNDIALRADDTGGHSGQSAAFNVVTPTVPVITSGGTALACVGQPFSYQILATNGPQSYDATSLPPGLSVNTSTGLISGIPTSVGNSTIALTASNASGPGGKNLSLVVLADGDSDGMPDDWELTYGLNPSSAADASLDKDGDGQSNRAEWLAGTAPNNSAANLRITNEQFVGNDVIITWAAVAGKRYRVVARTDFTPAGWTDLTPLPLVATTTSATYTHVGGKTSAPARFYRIEIVP